MSDDKMMKRKSIKVVTPPTYYYICPFDGTYSGEMQFRGKIYGLASILFDEIDALKGSPLIGERLQCPKCKRIFGWHQLKEMRDK